MKQKGFLKMLIIGMVTVVIITVSGYFIYTKISNKQQNNLFDSSKEEFSKGDNKATINTGWKKYNSDKNISLFTDSWKAYELNQSNTKTFFSIEYPNDWSLSGSVFHDSSGKKVAEVLSGVIILKKDQKCFDNINLNSNELPAFPSIISKEDIFINGLQGMLIINKVHNQGYSGPEYWYNNTYCLSNGKNAAEVTFYEYEEELNSDKRELFNQIISTLTFTLDEN